MYIYPGTYPLEKSSPPTHPPQPKPPASTPPNLRAPTPTPTPTPPVCTPSAPHLSAPHLSAPHPTPREQVAQLQTLVERVGRLEGRYGADRGTEEASGSMSSLGLPVSSSVAD